MAVLVHVRYGSGAFFSTVNAANRYAVLWLVLTAKKPERRAKRIETLVAMLTRGEKIHPSSPIGARLGQDVIAADLVVQRIEAIAGFSLRFRVQRHLQLLNTLWS